eukprot:1387744-Prymnesium_polylepis.1
MTDTRKISIGREARRQPALAPFLSRLFRCGTLTSVAHLTCPPPRTVPARAAAAGRVGTNTKGPQHGAQCSTSMAQNCTCAP